MPAGDLVVADWTFELRGVLMGDGTNYEIDRERGAIGGLLGAAPKYAETSYGHARGSFIGESFEAERTATFALAVHGATEIAAGDNLEAMLTVWSPDSTAELPLYFQLPGFGKRYVNGWPLGLAVSYTTPDFGLIPVIASFRITDPTIYT